MATKANDFSKVNMKGRDQVQANPSTGSVLVVHDTEHHASLDALLQSIGG